MLGFKAHAGEVARRIEATREDVAVDEVGEDAVDDRAAVVDAHDLGRGDERAMAERLPAPHVVAQLAVLRVARAGDDGDRLPAAGAAAEPFVVREQRRQQIIGCCARCRR